MVYTRKSSEEGLEQSYNSLHAQRDGITLVWQKDGMSRLLQETLAANDQAQEAVT